MILVRDAREDGSRHSRGVHGHAVAAQAGRRDSLHAATGRTLHALPHQPAGRHLRGYRHRAGAVRFYGARRVAGVPGNRPGGPATDHRAWRFVRRSAGVQGRVGAHGGGSRLSGWSTSRPISRPDSDPNFGEGMGRGRANDTVRLICGKEMSGRVEPWLPDEPLAALTGAPDAGRVGGLPVR